MKYHNKNMREKEEKDYNDTLEVLYGRIKKGYFVFVAI